MNDMIPCGVKKLPSYTKGVSHLAYTIRRRVNHGKCCSAKCGKRASYTTPEGKMCFHHAAAVEVQS